MENFFLRDGASKSFDPEYVLFRGKDTETHEWVYGWYEMSAFGRWPVKPSIIPMEEAKDGLYTHIQIDPQTLGMFSGLRDRDGTPIYSGDVVKNHLGIQQVCIFERGSFWFVESIDFCYGERQGENFCACSKRYKDAEKGITMDKVIGNIFDNPELVAKYLD